MCEREEKAHKDRRREVTRAIRRGSRAEMTAAERRYAVRHRRNVVHGRDMDRGSSNLC